MKSGNKHGTNKGKRTRDFFPLVLEHNNLQYINATRRLNHFLTGQGPYFLHLHRLNLRETPTYDCGAIGTPNPVVYEWAEMDETMMSLKQ